jgi:hypothetical protein
MEIAKRVQRETIRAGNHKAETNRAIVKQNNSKRSGVIKVSKLGPNRVAKNRVATNHKATNRATLNRVTPNRVTLNRAVMNRMGTSAVAIRHATTRTPRRISLRAIRDLPGNPVAN